MPRAMATGVVGNITICVHTTQAPSDAEWGELVNAVKGFKDISKVKSLIVTHGGAPSSTQRRLLNDLLQGRASLCAVVSSSSMVRGVVTALNWFNPQVKTFEPSSMDEAFRYLKL